MLTFQFLMKRYIPKNDEELQLQTLHNYEFKTDRITVLYVKV